MYVSLYCLLLWKLNVCVTGQSAVLSVIVYCQSVIVLSVIVAS